MFPESHRMNVCGFEPSLEGHSVGSAQYGKCTVWKGTASAVPTKHKALGLAPEEERGLQHD
ncbi:MAG TPA: hypothetical protein VN684_00195 [Terriglobales bacterium]|nr:hypothetical protein [Terriglobales bacterium]